MVKKQQHSEQRWRTARASFRMHEDLRDALEFVARADRRTISQIIEIMVVDYVRATLKNAFDDNGELVPPVKALEFRDGKDPRKR
jgi:predicted transcriptional regulator